MAFTLFRMLALLIIAVLFVILGFIFLKGISVISWEFITSMPSDGMTSEIGRAHV